MTKFYMYEHNEHMCRLQSTCSVELVAYNYFLAIYMNKCVYFCKALVYNATSDIKKNKFTKMYIVVQFLIHLPLLAKHAVTFDYLLLKKSYIYDYSKRRCSIKITLATLSFRL